MYTNNFQECVWSKNSEETHDISELKSRENIFIVSVSSLQYHLFLVHHRALSGYDIRASGTQQQAGERKQ